MVTDAADRRPEAVAWAAGFFDGDGCFTVKNHEGRLHLVASITQSPERPGTAPAVLMRFRSVVGQGEIGGPDPANRAFYWQTSATERSSQVFAVLRPWLSHQKVCQFRSVLDGVVASQRKRRRPIGPRSVAYRAAMARLEAIHAGATMRRDEPPRERSTELAWAAGFFDAEGSTYNRRSMDLNGDVLKIAAKVGQSSEDGTIAKVLLRFRDAVGLGYFNGPYRDRGRLPHYVWQVAAYADVVRLHEALDEWLGPVKREQADAALDAFIQYRSCRPRGADGLLRLRRAVRVSTWLIER